MIRDRVALTYPGPSSETQESGAPKDTFRYTKTFMCALVSRMRLALGEMKLS